MSFTMLRHVKARFNMALVYVRIIAFITLLNIIYLLNIIFTYTMNYFTMYE